MNGTTMSFAEFVPQLAKALKGIARPIDADSRESTEITVRGAELWVHTANYGPDKGKLIVSVNSGHYTDAQGNRQFTSARDVTQYGDLAGATTSIKVSMSRGVAAVARDIERRLLPDARKVWAAMEARKTSALDYASATVATAAKLAQAASTVIRGQNKNVVYADGTTMTAQGDSVRIEAFSVPLATALKIVKLLKEVQS